MGTTIAKCYSQVNSNLRVPLHSRLLFTPRMENKEIRRANLVMLAGQHGTVQALADKTNIDASHLRNVINRRDGRNLGDELAKRIEDQLGKPRGWMDVLHETDANISSWDVMLGVLQNLQEDRKPAVLSAIHRALAAPQPPPPKGPYFSTLPGNKPQAPDLRNRRRTRR